MKPIDGPDFICIGMPKAGTGWLYDQLQSHPDFWMPPVKELLYLNRGISHIPLGGKRGGHGFRLLEEPIDDREGKRTRPRSIPRDPARDVGFREVAQDANGKPMDIERYVALFRFKGDLLSGDISPMYTELDVAVIEKLRTRLPGTKLIMIAREPVARAWSRICMAGRGNKIGRVLLNDHRKLRAFLEQSGKIKGKSFPSGIVRHWRAHAPEMELRTFLLDDIAQDPERTRREIWTYLGASPDRPSPLPANYNRKSKTRKIEMTDGARKVLVDFFADEIRSCAEMFGGRARDWPGKYGL